MSDVPAEILREILSRLPVAPLLRFRCVSKQWKCLIDSNDFMKDHLDHSRKSNSHLNIIMKDFTYLHSIDFDLLNQTNRFTFQQLFHPLKTQYLGPDVLGSCDGLLALSSGHEDIIFWNPSARMFHKLPSSTDLPFFGFIVYGFGFDFLSNDYKLVRIFQVLGEGDHYIDSQVKLYNLKSHSWRTISDFPYCLKYKCYHGELVNAALHWLVSRKENSDNDTLVAAFDLGTEEYRLVAALPEFASDDVRVSLVVLGGCLSITCIYFMNQVDVRVSHVDIWVMKEYGVKESWSILFTLRPSDVSFMEFDNLTLRPIEYSKCGRKVFIVLNGHLLMWYDIDKKSVDLPLPVLERPIANCYQFYPCVQSLVLLKSGICDFNIATKKKQNTESKGSGKRDDFLSKGFKFVL